MAEGPTGPGATTTEDPRVAGLRPLDPRWVLRVIAELYPVGGIVPRAHPVARRGLRL